MPSLFKHPNQSKSLNHSSFNSLPSNTQPNQVSPKKGVIASYLKLHPKDRIILASITLITGLTSLYIIGDEDIDKTTVDNPYSYAAPVKRFFSWCGKMMDDESTNR